MIWRHKWDCTHCCSYWTSILSTTGLTTRSTIENCDVTSLSGAFLWQTNIKSCQNKVPPCSSVSNKPLPPFSFPLSQGEGGGIPKQPQRDVSCPGSELGSWAWRCPWGPKIRYLPPPICSLYAALPDALSSPPTKILSLLSKEANPCPRIGTLSPV